MWALWVALFICGIAIAGNYFLGKYGHRQWSARNVINPEKVTLQEIAKSIESMAPMHRPIPDPSGEDTGFMRIVTGKGSVKVRPIPDKDGAYQIDVVRYAVVYNRSDTTPQNRNYLTVVLNIIVKYRGGAWKMEEVRAGSSDEISTPGQRKPDVKTHEWISKEDATWYATPVVDYLSGMPPNPEQEAINAVSYAEDHASFEHQERLRESMRANGLTPPK